MAGVSSQVVRFQKSTGGNGTTQDVNLNFTPKAIIVFSSGGTNDASTEAHFMQIYGFSDGTNHACYATVSEDGAGAADAGRIHYNNRVFAKLDTATVTTVVCQGTCAFASNKVTFTWTVNDAVATDITLVAYGGTDITAVKVNTVDIGRTTAGTQDYTGLGFTPTDNNSALFTLAAFTQTANTATDYAIGGFGCATKVLAAAGTGNQWSLSHCSEDVSDPSDTYRALNNDRCFILLDTTGAYVQYSWLKSWVSDGFQLSWDGPPTATTFKFSYMVINGGKWDSGSLTAPTTPTNNVDYTVLSGITALPIRSLILASTGAIAGIAAVNTYSIGATDGTTTSAVAAVDEDAQATMDSYRYSDATGINHLMGTNGATSNRATFDSFSTNNFRLDWGTKDGTASLASWVVVADATTSVTDTNTFLFNILSEVTDTNTFLFNILQEVTDTNTFLFNILQELTDTNTFLFNILSEVTDTNTFLFNIIAETTKTNTFLFDILQELTDTNTFLFNILQEVEDTNTFLFDIEAAFVIKDNTFLFDIIAETTKTNTFLYDILQEVEDTNTFLFNILSEIDPKTNTFLFDIIAETTKTNTFLFDIIAETTKTNTFLYNILNEIDPKTNTFLFNIIAEVTDTNTFLFNILAETTKSLTLRFDIEAFVEVVKTLTSIFNINPAIAEFITDPGYSNPLTVRLTFKSKKNDTFADESGDQVIYYQYDPYDFDNRPFNLTQFSIRLTQGEISTASLVIEDHQELITDLDKISKKAIVEVDFKKELARDWERILTGYVRSIRILRSASRALSYAITVKSKQIRYNERIVDFKRAAKRSSVTSTEALATDSRMLANNLFRELHTATDIFPRKNSPTIQQSGDFDLDTGTISEDVIDFITEIAPGLTTAAEVLNQLVEGIGAIWGVDEFGNPYLRYPTEKHSGIIITDSPADTDSALNTAVNMGSFDFENSTELSEGFANRIYVLNSKETKVMEGASSNKSSGFTTLTNRYLAQSFTATEPNITGAAFILSRTGNPTNSTGTIRVELRAASTPNGTFPTGAVLATAEISFSQLNTAKDTIFVNDIKHKEGVINIGQRYWWVLLGIGLRDESNTVNWHHDDDFVTSAGRLRSASVTSTVDTDPTKPGVQILWNSSDHGPVYSFSTFSSINHILTQSDPESVQDNDLIETVVNLPAFSTDADYKKVMVKLLRDSAKEKRIFDLTKVTIPTARLFKPGEMITIIDSKANLDAEKIINAEIVEVTYNFDTNTNAMGCRYVDLRCVGFIDTIIDNYLENREC